MTSREDAIKLFDSLEPVDIDFMMGRWQGEGYPTGRPQDGLLEAFHWYGKHLNPVKMCTHCCFRTGEVKLSASTPVQWLVEANRVDRRQELQSGSFSS